MKVKELRDKLNKLIDEGGADVPLVTKVSVVPEYAEIDMFSFELKEVWVTRNHIRTDENRKTIERSRVETLEKGLIVKI